RIQSWWRPDAPKAAIRRLSSGRAKQPLSMVDPTWSLRRRRVFVMATGLILASAAPHVLAAIIGSLMVNRPDLEHTARATDAARQSDVASADRTGNAITDALAHSRHLAATGWSTIANTVAKLYTEAVSP